MSTQKKYLIKDLVTQKYLSHISATNKPTWHTIMLANAYVSVHHAEIIIDKLIKENKFLTIETVYR